MTTSASQSLDFLLSQLNAPGRIRNYLLKNRGARYALVCAVSAVLAALVEAKRRSDRRDDAKRKIPHRRNSAVLLYDGDYYMNRGLTVRFVRDIRALQE